MLIVKSCHQFQADDATLTISRKDNKRLYPTPPVVYLGVGLEAIRGYWTLRPIDRQSFQIILDGCLFLIDLFLALRYSRLRIGGL